MSSIPVDVLLFTYVWKKRKQTVLIALHKTQVFVYKLDSSFLVQCVSFSSTSEYASSPRFLFLRKVELTTNKHEYLCTAPLSLLLHHIPQNRVRRHLPPRKNKLILITERYFIVPPSQILTFVRRP